MTRDKPLEITPGPWWNHGGLGHEDVIVGADAAPIAIVSKHNIHAAGNVALVVSAPQLLAALREARAFIAAELGCSLRSFCVCTGGEPDRATLDPDGREIVDELDALLAQIDAALDAAGCGGDGT